MKRRSSFVFLSLFVILSCASFCAMARASSWLEESAIGSAGNAVIQFSDYTMETVSTAVSCGCEGKGCSRCCDPLWTARVGLVYMKRENPDEQTVFVDGDFDSNLTPTFNADQFDFDYEAGVDASLRRRLGACRELEFRFLWLSNQTDSLSFGDDDFFQGAARVDSEFYSGEINIRRKTRHCFDIIYGFRYLHLEDSLGIQTSVVDYFPLDLGWRTQNDLYGFQVGLDALLWKGCRGLRIEGIVKGGIYGNDVSTSFTGQNEYSFQGGDDDGDVAFIGELGLTAVYDVTCRLSVMAGYQAMWLEGVAVAVEQVGATPSPFAVNGARVPMHVDSSGGMLFHGALAGAQYVW